MILETKVKITFESNDFPDKKCTLTIIDDVKLEIKFEPEISKEDSPEYGKYLNAFMKMITS